MYNITEEEYIDVCARRGQSQIDQAFNFIDELLLQGRISLEEVPTELRIENPLLYISAFRIVHGLGCNEMVEMLQLLQSDILAAIKSCRQIGELTDIFAFNLNVAKNNYNGEEEYVDYEKAIPKEILQIVL